MSDIRFNRWLHQSGTGGVSQDSSGNIGIGTTVPTMALDVRGDVNIGNTININNASGIISATTLTATTLTATTGTFSGNVSIAGTLTYEDVTNIDAVGVITAKAGIDVTGGHIDLVDNSRIRVGTGTDLQLYHASGNSYIDNGTGSLYIRGANGNHVRIQSPSGEDSVVAAANGSVELYYDTGKRLETSNAGVTVTGALTATSFSGNLTGNVTGNVTGDLTGNLAGISSIAGISSSISNTAVDVFVYDTSKDSDGGEWRKRTSHTSWYNEAAAAGVRGSRKEFPAVAVIVAEATKLTIYDGDDPDLPLWMAFNLLGAVGGNSNMLPRGGSGTESDITSIACLNGRLVVGLKDVSGTVGEGLIVIDFISELARVHRTEGSGYTGAIYNLPISGRNSNSEYYGDYNSLAIVAETCNDVAMTVLPNAPIDDATGLPVPTIAVATDSGVSVIKDDGIVADITSSKAVNDVDLIHFDKSGRLYFAAQASSSVTDIYQFNRYVIPSSDISNNVYEEGADATYFSYATSGSFANVRPNFNARYNDGTNEDITSIVSNNDGGIVGNVNGLSLFAEDYLSQNNGMVAYAATSYNTGWMQGDIKGAFLSDTDTTNITGSNLIDNGDFGTGNFTNWSTSGTTAPSISSGGALLTTGAADGAIWQSTSGEATSGKWVITWTVTSNSGGFFGLFLNNNGANGSGGSLVYDGWTTSGSYYYEGSITSVEFRHRGSSSGIIDNITLRRVEDDRSVNNKGLQVFGTVTKSAVATGADLVAYSGFSASNYLQQPYNSDLAPGTAAYSVSCWFKTGTSSGDQYIFDRNGGGSNNSRNLLLIMQSTASGGNANKFQWWHRDASGNVTDIKVSDKTITDNVWHQVVAVNDGSTYKLYVDGDVSSITNSTIRNVGNDNDPPMYVGVRHTLGSTYMTGSMALFRYSKSAPSPEQIKKIYDDEKHLFQENAKATLYGSSDAVTALGYDDDTELLHVGTTSGRSDFQRLRRINNTTDPVTTAISASDDLIAEQ